MFTNAQVEQRLRDVMGLRDRIASVLAIREAVRNAAAVTETPVDHVLATYDRQLAKMRRRAAPEFAQLLEMINAIGAPITGKELKP